MAGRLARRWCCSRRDTRGKRGYDGGPFGTGVAEWALGDGVGVGVAEWALGRRSGRLGRRVGDGVGRNGAQLGTARSWISSSGAPRRSRRGGPDDVDAVAGLGVGLGGVGHAPGDGGPLAGAPVGVAGGELEAEVGFIFAHGAGGGDFDVGGEEEGGGVGCAEGFEALDPVDVFGGDGFELDFAHRFRGWAGGQGRRSR